MFCRKTAILFQVTGRCWDAGRESEAVERGWGEGGCAGTSLPLFVVLEGAAET